MSAYTPTEQLAIRNQMIESLHRLVFSVTDEQYKTGIRLTDEEFKTCEKLQKNIEEVTILMTVSPNQIWRYEDGEIHYPDTDDEDEEEEDYDSEPDEEPEDLFASIVAEANEE